MLSSGNEEGEALAEAVGEGVAVDVSRGVGDCAGVGLGVTLGDDGLALVAGSGGAPAAVSVALDHKIGLYCGNSGFAIRNRRRVKTRQRAGLVALKSRVLDEDGNVAQTIGNEDGAALGVIAFRRRL